MFFGLGRIELAAILGASVVAATGAGGYLLGDRVRGWFGSSETPLEALRQQLVGVDDAALVVPESATVDAIAAALGLASICAEWGVSTTVVAAGPLTSDDAKTFCNLFDADVTVASAERVDADAAVAVGGSGSVPSLPSVGPVVAVVRHRSVSDDDRLAYTGEGSATATVVADLLERAGIAPDRRTATALLYGVRAGTNEFRRVRSAADYRAAEFLHGFANQSRLDALRTPGLSDEMADVVGTAIENRERRATVAVTNVGSVSTVGALEEAADTMLRLDGVTSAGAFGVYDGTVVVSCHTEDVRTNARDVLSTAFETASVSGTTEAATARIELGLFGRVSDEKEETLDELIDLSVRRSLFGAFEES